MHSRRAAGWTSVFLGAFNLFLTLFPDYGHALLVTKFIDSNNGDPDTGFKVIYSVATSTAWNDQTCGGCYIQPDPNRAFQGTWNSATYHPNLRNVSFTLQFTGVSVSVFFILANANIHGPTTTTNTQCNFTLDGQHVGSYSHDPDMSTMDQVYNVPVFSKTGLSNSPHQLIVSANDYPISTFINFDYATYEVVVPDPPSPSPTTSPQQQPNSPQSQTTSPTSQAQTSASSSSSQSSTSGAPSSNSASTLSSSTNKSSTGVDASGIGTGSPPSTTSASSLGFSSSTSGAGTVAPQTSQKTNIILGSAIGGAVLVIIIVALLLLRCLRRSKSSSIPSGSSIGQPDSLTPLTGAGHIGSGGQVNIYGPNSSTALAGPGGLSSAALLVAGAGLSSSSTTSRWELPEKLSEREREVTERIQSAQREREQFAYGSEAGMTSISEREIASLNNQIDELRAQLSQLQTQRRSIQFGEQPPAYTRL